MSKMKKHLYRKIRYGIEVIAHIFGRGENEKYCPCCGYTGIFETYGQPPRYGALCPSCGSLERHRLFALINQKINFIEKKDILHFAPEPVLSRIIRSCAKSYISADLNPGSADIVLNCEKIEQPDEGWDVIICFHVLEHINDHLALSEFHRTLRKGGKLLVMAPIIEGWDTTYENPCIVSNRDREIHFGQHDHVRYYGRDIRNRLITAGFELQEYSSSGIDSIRYGLTRGEKLFVCNKAC